MDKKRNARPSWLKVIIIVSLVSVGAYFVARGIVNHYSSHLGTARPTPAYAGQSVEPLGDGMVYYDGATLHALNDRGRPVWSYAAGMNAGFSVGSGGVATWSGNMLSLLTEGRGETLFSGEVDGPVINARLGTMYAAAQVGEEHNSTMLVMEVSGRPVEKIELKNTTVLDFGFFNNDTLLWVMGLDTEGTVPVCSISTYRPGRMLLGTITDTRQVLYEVVFQSNIRAVGTTHIRDYQYGNKEIKENAMLVYGWYLMSIDDRSSNPLMAFVPTGQSDGASGFNDLRMIRGQQDQWVRLPLPAIRVMAFGDAVYAFTNQEVMVIRMGEVTPAIYTLPIYVDGVLGITGNKTAIVTSGGGVQLIPLP
ncbi:hypothetical protein ACH6CV_11915 [Bacillota bacterium Meth-B3]